MDLIPHSDDCCIDDASFAISASSIVISSDGLQDLMRRGKLLHAKANTIVHHSPVQL